MQRKNVLIILFLTLLSFSMSSCCSNRNTGRDTTATATNLSQNKVKSSHNTTTLPQAIIYRTDRDYSQYVPINLSEDGNRILSYPAPSDISDLAKPISLKKGYLLDRRGISQNSAFLDYTYEAYAKLPVTPSFEELTKHILAKQAIVEMYRLPINASAAMANPSLCEFFIDNHFKDCARLK